MKLTLNLSLFLIFLFTFVEKSFSLTDYQIKNICKKEKRVSNCIKDFKEKRSKLQRGNAIEIPILPYKK